MYFREEIGESLTLKFAATAAERRRKNLPIISLGLGEPDFDVPCEIIQETIKVLQTQKALYSDPMGLLPFREKIALKLKTENQINCSANNILVSAGAKQAFQQVCMAVLQPGDEVIILNPSFVSFIPQIYIAEPQAKVRIVDIEKHSFTLPLETIKKVIKPATKLLVINSPNNPAGYVINSEQLRYLYELAIENDFFIISDEIYEKLIFFCQKHISIGSFEKLPERIITINGFSKSHAMTGWRLGYACFPMFFRDKILKLQQHMNTNTCTFIQKAMISAFDIQMNYLDDYRSKLALRAKMISEKFNDVSRVSLISPVGGFFAFINIGKLNLDSNTFCSNLLEETGVATTPGIAFGKNWDDHIRISFATDEETLSSGLELIYQFIINQR